MIINVIHVGYFLIIVSVKKNVFVFLIIVSVKKNDPLL